ncbi:MAG: transcription antitermination factor NusB [Planctomycetota bacterium]|nr:transcription antitermination factor NusB [Planctomycetota bacterium]
MSRQTAYYVLRSGSPQPLRQVQYFADKAGLDDRDRGLARALVGCEVRRRATLRAIVGLFAKGKPSADILTLLRLGVAQMLFMDSVPDHAALSETVRTATNNIGLARGRYVNGVLRSIQRARREGLSGDPRRDVVGTNWHFDLQIFRDPEAHPFLWAEDALSIPSNLFKRWHKRFGMEQATQLAKQALTETDLSVSFPRGDRDILLAEFETLSPRLAEHDRIAVFDSEHGKTILASEAFASGKISIQGETALCAAEALEAKEGEAILDMCAAPGGKTAVLAISGAKVTAVDISEKRLETTKSTLERMGVVDNVDVVLSDGTGVWTEAEPMFDGALVDAPCSNTGVLAARAAARWRFGPQNQKELINIQARLLHQAAERVRPGGRMVYSTCSLEGDENDQQIRHFLGEHPDWTLAYSKHLTPGPVGSSGPTDGGFHALLRRNS